MYLVRSTAIAMCFAALALAPAMASAQTVDMKMGFVTINDSQHETAKLFKAEIEKRTKGGIKARIFPAAQLGSIPRQIEGIQFGTQEAFLVPPGFFVGINPAFQAPDAPAMFESHVHQHKAMNHPTVRDKFLGLAEHAGIVGVYIWSAGKTAIASRKPIRRIDDIEGLKLRVLATKMEATFLGTLGATGVPMPYSETLAAIQRRTIDGARTAIIVMGPSKFYTVTKHLYNEGTGYIPGVFWVSKLWLNKLPQDYREAIFDIGRDLTDRTGQIAVDITNRWEKLWVKNGGTIVEPTPEDRAEIYRRARPLGDKFLGGDPKVKEMYELVKAAAAMTKGATSFK